jgi:hypothetical protein
MFARQSLRFMPLGFLTACAFGVDLSGFFSPESSPLTDASARDGAQSARDSETTIEIDATGMDATLDSSAGKTDAGTSYPERVLADAPLAYWRLGETSGTVARDQTGRYAGVISAGVLLNQVGAIGGNAAMHFDGLESHIDFGDVLDFPNRAPFSVEAWVLPDVIDIQFRAVVSKMFLGNSSHLDGYSISFQRDAKTYFSFCLDDPDCFASPRAPLPQVARFTHVVATYDGSIGQIFYDGARVSLLNVTTAMVNNRGSFLIGRLPVGFLSPVDSFTGAIDEVAVYDHALSEASIRLHFAAALP